MKRFSSGSDFDANLRFVLEIMEFIHTFYLIEKREIQIESLFPGMKNSLYFEFHPENKSWKKFRMSDQKLFTFLATFSINHFGVEVAPQTPTD